MNLASTHNVTSVGNSTRHQNGSARSATSRSPWYRCGNEDLNVRRSSQQVVFVRLSDHLDAGMRGFVKPGVSNHQLSSRTGVEAVSMAPSQLCPYMGRSSACACGHRHSLSSVLGRSQRSDKPWCSCVPMIPLVFRCLLAIKRATCDILYKISCHLMKLIRKFAIEVDNKTCDYS